MDTRYSPFRANTIVRFQLDNTNKTINATQKDIGKTMKVVMLKMWLIIGKGGCFRITCEKV
jgi:hypothetical protein